MQFVTKADCFWRERDKEVDFVILRDKEIIPIEVKYSKKVRLKEIKGLTKFIEEYKIKQGFVITEDYEAKEMVKGRIIRFIPLWKWLIIEG